MVYSTADATCPVAFRRVELAHLGNESFALGLHIENIILEALRKVIQHQRYAKCVM